MAFDKTNKPCELPILKDKVIYISSSDSNIKMEQSYVISASYNGILRLSPNSYNTINEVNPVELTAAQDQSMSTAYSDAIVFDNSALALPETTQQSDMKTNADIRYRMIIGSDSDGYLVGFRLSDQDAEFDNLGVIGITKTGKLTIYSDADSTYPQALTIGKTIMPSLHNEATNDRAKIKEILEKYNVNDEYPKLPEQWDEIEIDITGKGDKSYLLSAHPDSDGNRVFEYTRSQQFIRNIIMETLLDVQSVPTGSVHWLPVTYEQYCTLVQDNNFFPNKFYKVINNNEIDESMPNDPIIRDYLLCDGRKYKTSQFPELAKILWKEKITYWDEQGVKKTSENGTPDIAAGEDAASIPNYFRVPDLRHKFISYSTADSVLNPLNEEPQNISKLISDNNKTGTYTPDNAPRSPSGQSGSNHFHFLAYGTYNEYNTYARKNSKGYLTPVVANDLYKFEGWDYNTLKTKITDSTFNPRVWYLSTTATAQSDIDGIYGYQYGFSRSGDRRRTQSTHDVITAAAWASAPKGGISNFKKEPTLGLTSKPITTYVIPSETDTNAETYTISKYETFEQYNDLEKNIQKTSLSTRYGHENAPKFYAMLPLIKI